MTNYTNTTPKTEKAILVALITQHQSAEKIKEYVTELALLTRTLGIQPVATFTQQLDKPNVKTFVGKGKLAEIKTTLTAEQADMVIFDDDLTPSQVKNLEQDLPCKVLDRSLLILDIFVKRAKTAQAKTQVALAQYQYLLPRLTKLWTHLSRQKGGIGMRGPGETELETDRRIVQDKIALLRKKLQAIERQNTTQRKFRKQLVRVALVGYTNVGKSTLMQLLSKEDVYAEDKLFATLDATVRKVVLRQVLFLLTDTVGFIRKLPHTLIESFRSTLAEVREADILLHVIDISHAAFEEQKQIVEDTLVEIGAADRPIILVFNKMDQFAATPTKLDDPKVSLAALQQAYENDPAQPVVFISALQKANLDHLKALLYQHVVKQHQKIYPNYLPST